MICTNEFYSNLKFKIIKVSIEKRCLMNRAEHVVENWQGVLFVQNVESQ